MIENFIAVRAGADPAPQIIRYGMIWTNVAASWTPFQIRPRRKPVPERRLGSAWL